MSRAQCIVSRENRILMVKHRQDGDEWWCLPGGGIEDGESPEEAAIRELWEECNVRGTIVRETSTVTYGPDDRHYSYLIDIGDQTPKMGFDPELADDAQVIVDMDWLSLRELAEIDRVFLWTAGLVGVPGIYEKICRWSREPYYPPEKGEK
ncbi:MAG: NUDIX hydrolase [Gemmatimonadetes bacterium]|jgi:8-oxo-dGTP diphosphatase|nr:NUDIX hydrolase [Gemmatimonadota bacterium]